jgi:hypothetical protein
MMVFMNRAKRSTSDRFTRLLEAIDRVEAGDCDANETPQPILHHVHFRCVPPLERPEMPMAGVAQLSDTLAWIGADEDPPAALLKRPLSSDPESVRAELGLGAYSTRAEIQRVRREFAVKNHPDLLDASQQDIATRRMTIANMLLDEALKRLR